MAFSLSDAPAVKKIKSKEGMDKRKTIARCFIVIKEQPKITPEVRDALVSYLEARVRNMSTVNLSSKLLQDNIQELLEYCCKKDYDDIVEEDVIHYERQILQQIRWCIDFKNTKRLVFIEDEYDLYNINSKKADKSDVFKAIDDVYDYFETRRRLYGDK